MLDPFGKEWVGDANPWTGIPGSVVWYIQVGLIVWGHIVAVFEAHRVSLGIQQAHRRALAAPALTLYPGAGRMGRSPARSRARGGV